MSPESPQYTEFLNAVDPEATNSLDLYNSEMGTSDEGGIRLNSGNPNGSKYELRTDRGNKPVNFVGLWDACRFANWLHNGQGSGDTETGAYTLTAEAITNNSVTRNAGWLWAVCSEDEWYKAAYYDAGDGVYYDYPTGSNTFPVGEPPPGTDTIRGSANYNWVVGGLTDVGAYTYKPSVSPYGTMDQGGNAWEWNETITNDSSRGVRGGAFNHTYAHLRANVQGNGDPTSEDYHIGFRVANIPEPSTAVLGIVGVLCGLWWWRRAAR